MKQWREIYKPYMRRPIVYKMAARVSAALLAVLLWDKYINSDGYLSLWTYGFFTVGVFFLMLAWFGYLLLDGVGVPKLFKSREIPKKKHRARRAIVDFADEKIVAFEELEPEERTMAGLLANLFSGLMFLSLALSSWLLLS